MKLRAIHLLNRMERIERDLNEMQTLRSTLQDDRDYAGRLRSSLQDETLRLRELQSQILAQVIQNPPAELVPESGIPAAVRAPEPAPVAAAHDAPAPEIILPGAHSRKNAAGSGKSSSNKSADAKVTAGDASKAAGSKQKPRGGAKQSDKPAKSGDAGDDFNFTFVQN